MKTPKPRPDKPHRLKMIQLSPHHQVHPSWPINKDEVDDELRKGVSNYLNEIIERLLKTARNSGNEPVIKCALSVVMTGESTVTIPATNPDATQLAQTAADQKTSIFRAIAAKIEATGALGKCRPEWRVLTRIPGLEVKRYKPTSAETAARIAIEFIVTVCYGFAVEDNSNEPLRQLHAILAPHQNPACNNIVGKVAEKIVSAKVPPTISEG